MTTEDRRHSPPRRSEDDAALRALAKEAIYKEVVKEALSEWLDKQYAVFGRWSLRGIVSATLVVILYLWLSAHGWHP
jgi:hypothetical protein